MIIFKMILILKCFLIIFVSYTTSIRISEEVCFDCICGNRNHCGITKGFWKDGGKIMNNYEDCLKDFTCPLDTMRNYYKRYQMDCDGNGDIDCYDFLRIHIFGPLKCTKPTNAYIREIEECIVSS